MCIRDSARNHVYELSEKDYHSISFPHYLVKISGEKQKNYRILCDDILNESWKREPEIEDGYMYLVKGPFHEV